MWPKWLLLQIRSLKKLKESHGLLATAGFLSPCRDSSSTLSQLLFSFSNLNPLPVSSPPSLEYALTLFHQIPYPSTFNYNILIRILTLFGDPLAALKIFSTMRHYSIPPDHHTVPYVLVASARISSPMHGFSLHAQTLKLGFSKDQFTLNALISLYAAFGFLSNAQKLFSSATHLDLVSYNSLLDGYVKSGNLQLARKLFNEMPKKDRISYGTLLAGYADRRHANATLELFSDLTFSGLEPDDTSIVAALCACAQTGVVRHGRALHGYIHGRRSSVFLATALVDMYAKCGLISSAIDTFRLSPEKNLFTWNALISGLGVHGHGDLSLQYFDEMMKSGVRPDGTTFLTVLSSCSHAGLVEDARKIFAEMEKRGVKPELKHYGCMADLLGRCGMIAEAAEMIRSMPMNADAYVWGGVLGGCRIHGDVTMAETAASRLLEINPKDVGVYSLLTDVYASERRWDDVAAMRMMVGKMKVRKSVARSEIQEVMQHMGKILIADQHRSR